MNASAETIARALGGAFCSSGWWRCKCPVHNSSGSTLALRDGFGVLLVRCHADCSRADILAELSRRGLFGGVDNRPPPDPSEQQRRLEAEIVDRQRRIDWAHHIWSQTDPAIGTLVEVYLWSRLIMSTVPPVIRLHRSLRHKESGQRRPAAVARVDHVQFGSVGVHVTWLQPDGAGKAALQPVRKTFGPIDGGSVQLGNVQPDCWLVVGEGIESVMSVMLALGLPGWAALSAGGVEHLVLPPDARMILIAGDNDISGTGQRAAYAAACRWIAEGRRVKVCIPPAPETDWNDVLRGRAPAGAGRVGHAA